ncbi:MAG: hypothetical protein IJ391_05810 [Clostridia bacterium]|nr:hypothetical protein [Clostridia bacterium]
MSKIINKYISLLLLTLTLFIFALLPLSADGDNKSIIKSVEISGERDRITVSASIDKSLVEANKDKQVYLFELLPSNDIDDINTLTPSAQKEISESVSISIDFKKRAVYSSFVLAVQNEDSTYFAVTERHYVDNPELLASNSEEYPYRPTKKGLNAQITSDAQHLGVAHTIISIEIDEYIAPFRTSSTVPFTRYGQTFYFYEDKLAALDHKVKVYTEAGINVYFNIVLGKSDMSELNFLYLNSNSSTASLFAINTSTIPSSRYFSVFCEFMAERYSNSEHTNGFVPAYILGYEVNSTGMWNYAGEIAFDNYVRCYENAYRILYSAVKSTYENAKVFVSVSNLFTADEGVSDFGAKDFLTTFAENMKVHGDTEWALAINPYASDTSVTEFWNDEKATDSLDTQYITMKNLDVLSEFMRLENMTSDNGVRDIIISEFGIHGSFEEARNNDCQAAAYALAYAIADQNDDIDAFLYYRHVDHPAEPVHFGLWTSNAISPLTPENKKAIYTIFENVDTKDYSGGLEMAHAFIGEELYNKYLANYEPTPKRIVTDAVPVLKTDIRASLRESVLFDLTIGDFCGFYPSDNSSYVELRPVNEDDYTTALYSHLNPESAQTYSGISCSLKDIDLSRTEYITLSFKPVTPGTETLTVMLMLDSDKDGKDLVYEGIVQLPSNNDSELTFKLSDYIKATDGSIETLKLWYKPSSGTLSDGEYGLWLKSVTIHERTGFSSFISVFSTALKIALILAAAALIIFAYAYKPVRNRIKGIIGKTRSKLIGFLKDKKIISRRHKKKKGAKITPPKNAEQTARPAQSIQSGTRPVQGQTSGVRIVNGRVLPRTHSDLRKPSSPSAQAAAKNTDDNANNTGDNGK